MNKLWPLTLCLILMSFLETSAQLDDVRSAVERAADAVCNKKVVILGELPSHGEGAAFEAKSRIVRRLVERCYFDAVLFEAPIYDFVGFETALAKRSATQHQLDRAIGRFWLTRELSDWRAWLFRRSIAGKLVVGGLDDQVSVTSEYARATLPGLVSSLIQPAKSVECEQVVSRNLYWRYDAAKPFDDSEQRLLRNCVDLAFNEQSRISRHRRRSEQLMLENLSGFVERQTRSQTAVDRDKAMYRNYLWYSRRIGPHKKVIIWTSTVHAARSQGPLPVMPLGARLGELLADRLAVIGFTAFSGRSSMAGQPAKDLLEAPPGSLEALTTGKSKEWVLVNSNDLKRLGSFPSRLFGNFQTADWSSFFDAVLVIRHEFAPGRTESRTPSKY